MAGAAQKINYEGQTVLGAGGGLKLSTKISEGGEGAVYNVDGKPDVVAKIYHDSKLSSSPELEGKIEYMASNPPAQSILDQVAWSTELIRSKHGKFIGFAMRRIKGGTALYDLYIKQIGISKVNMLIVAINICNVLSEVHKAGYVFGDFNPQNINVDLSSGHVSFFDTDAFCFTGANGRKYIPEAILNGYTAPEALFTDANGRLERNYNKFSFESDYFALAIHIFKLLENKVEPYSGIDESIDLDDPKVSVPSPGVGDKAIFDNNYCFNPGKKPLSPDAIDMLCFPLEVIAVCNTEIIVREILFSALCSYFQNGVFPLFIIVSCNIRATRCRLYALTDTRRRD